MIDWLTSIVIGFSLTFIMTLSFCCFKRDRATYSVSSNDSTHHPIASITKSATVTLAPFPATTNLPIESDYEKIIGSSADGEIHLNNDYNNSTNSIDYGGYTKITPIRNQQQSFDDETQLYATVDKTRSSVNQSVIRTTPSATAAIAAAIRQGSSPASTTASSSPQAIFSPSSHLTGYTMTSQAPPEHPPPPLPPPLPLPPLLPQVYETVNTNHVDSSRRPHYDEVITRESLQYRAQRLQLEQQLRENYYSSVNSERGTITGSELYAEIANGSASGTVHQIQQSHYYSRPSAGSGVGDDLSERYATVVETVEQPATNRIYQEVDTLKL